MSIPFLRPIQSTDVEAVYELAKETGGGMTNLPTDRDALRERIDASVESYSKKVDEPGGEVYTLALERDGVLLGVAGVFYSIGLAGGFVNYRINQEFCWSSELGKSALRSVLVPTHDLTGHAEVGALYLSSKARGGGLGKLLARSRYLFIAQCPERIAPRICAEMRGWRAEDGSQPFWNAVGSRFFQMDFEEADLHNSVYGNQFISDLMPRYPIYMALLPEAARACVGKPHDNALPAFNMLLAEGFAFNNYVDIFDGGPVVDIDVANIRTVRDSRALKVRAVHDKLDEETALLAAGAVNTFRCCKAPARIEGGEIEIDRDTAAALNVETGGEIRWAKW